MIERKCGRPENVFKLLEKELEVTDFAKRRILAERKARAQSNKEEVTLDEIYQSFDGLSLDQIQRYKRAEIECETAQATIKDKGKRLYDYVLAAGKEILIISDMYLPQEFIEKLINADGYREYKKCYVSAEMGLRKKTGNLYRHIQKEQSIDTTRWLHIGDDVITDRIGASKMGIEGSII